MITQLNVLDQQSGDHGSGIDDCFQVVIQRANDVVRSKCKLLRGLTASMPLP